MANRRGRRSSIRTDSLRWLFPIAEQGRREVSTWAYVTFTFDNRCKVPNSVPIEHMQCYGSSCSSRSLSRCQKYHIDLQNDFVSWHRDVVVGCAVSSLSRCCLQIFVQLCVLADTPHTRRENGFIRALRHGCGHLFRRVVRMAYLD